MDQRLMAGKNATPDLSWPGYRLKAISLLMRLERGELRDAYRDGPLRRDGDWIQLGRTYNVGAKLLVYMVDNHMLVRRGHNTSAPAWVEDWYRVIDKKPPQRAVLTIKVKRGPAVTDRERQPLKYGEWVWLTDTQQLATGDGVSQEPLTGHYHGGLVTFLFEARAFGFTDMPHFRMPMPMPPLSVPAEILDTLVLDEGEVVYCPEHDWLFVGDGKTKGGIRAK